MNFEKAYNKQGDLLNTKVTLPSPAQIELIEKQCEYERGEAVWSVLAAPFTAIKGLLSYTGQAEPLVAEFEGTVTR